MGVEEIGPTTDTNQQQPTDNESGTKVQETHFDQQHFGAGLHP